MTVFDYAVLVVICVSILVSVIRGLVREVLALVAWVTAFVMAGSFGGRVADFMPAAISSEELRLLAGFVTTFFAVLVVMSLAAMAVSRLIKSAGLGVEDRMFGMLFGLVRGALVVLVLVLAAGLTTLPRNPAWRNAALSSPLEALAIEIKGWLPGNLAQRIKYD